VNWREAAFVEEMDKYLRERATRMEAGRPG
jgi:hypothetical protein